MLDVSSTALAELPAALGRLTGLRELHSHMLKGRRVLSSKSVTAGFGCLALQAL